MTISTLALTPLISLIAGVLILVMPRLLNYIVALYLIVVGLLGLFPHLVRCRGAAARSPREHPPRRLDPEIRVKAQSGSRAACGRRLFSGSSKPASIFL